MEPENQHQYNIFKTRWGWFGILGCNDGLMRTQLPDTEKEAVKSRLLQGIGEVKKSKTTFSALETQIQDYYQGKPVNFSNVKVCLEGFSVFQRHVLSILRRVRYGKTVSYRQLANMADNPNAARAIGSVMAANPLPLIIPCHRVIKSDGRPGQFSAAGGTQTKIRMLKIEKA